MPVESTLNPHIAEEMAHLFTAMGVGAPEREYLEIVCCLIDASKPKHALCISHKDVMDWFIDETESVGFTKLSVSMGQAAEYGPVNFAFLDGLPMPQRADDLASLIERGLLTPRAVVAIHDTSRCRTLADGSLDPEAAEFWSRMERNVIRRFKPRAVLELPLSRGLTLIQV